MSASAPIDTSGLDTLANRVSRYQQALRLSDEAFAKRFAEHVGSWETWTRTIRPDTRDAARLTHRNIALWEKRLQRFVSEIEGVVVDDVPIYDMPILRAARTLYERLQGAHGDMRTAWLIGPTGIGKTFSLQVLRKEHPAETVYVRADLTWRDRSGVICCALASALGLKAEAADGAHVNLERILAHVRMHTVTILLDEMHEGGTEILKTIKIINDAGGRFLLTTWPTGYDRMISGSSDASSESYQLCARSIGKIMRHWVGGCRPEDVAAYLSFAVSDIPAERRKLLAQQVYIPVAKLGLRLLDSVIRNTRLACEMEGVAIDADAIHAECQAEIDLVSGTKRRAA
jgi:hypothetical protein